MSKKKVEISTINLNQIEKDPSYLLSSSDKTVNKHKKLLDSYGNVSPILVANTDNKGILRLIKGQNTIKAAEQLGIKDLISVIYNDIDKINQLLLALNLSLMADNIDAISQGAIIEQLCDEHNFTQTHLANKLGKSKSWISKRLSLKKNLTEDVKQLVENGSLCSRTAEELAKLDQKVQIKFASQVLNYKMSKNLVAKLVKLYNDPNSKVDLKMKILDSPMNVKFIDNIKTNKTNQHNKYDNFEKTLIDGIEIIKDLSSMVDKYHEDYLLTFKEQNTNFYNLSDKLIKKLSIIINK
ncbi:MAG: hypothetical protein LBF97_07205 [Elusimicrobiota bacterium]|jgi:ParB family chromosome partitioning protein|nr:hypothetical protein [Elusimicrobiota bacterium]